MSLDSKYKNLNYAKLSDQYDDLSFVFSQLKRQRNKVVEMEKNLIQYDKFDWFERAMKGMPKTKQDAAKKYTIALKVFHRYNAMVKSKIKNILNQL